MSNIKSNTLTKEQLFACLEYDGINVHVDIINQAKNNAGEALRDLGYEYDSKLKDYPKAMAWYQLGADQNNSNAYNNIGVLYALGQGVSQDYLTAIEYYLRAARDNHNIARSNIAFKFLSGNGVSLDKYKALEWYIKSGEEPEEVNKLNQEGVHLREEDKNKTIYQLANEADNIVREERMKKESKLTKENEKLKKTKSSNEQEMEHLREENQTLQIELQQKQQQIIALDNEKELSKEKDETIKALYLTTDTLQSLVQAKTNENDVLKRDIQRLDTLEQMNRKLNCKIQEYQRLTQESISLPDVLDYDVVSISDNEKSETDTIIKNNNEESQKKRDIME